MAETRRTVPATVGLLYSPISQTLNPRVDTTELRWRPMIQRDHLRDYMVRCLVARMDMPLVGSLTNNQLITGSMTGG